MDTRNSTGIWNAVLISVVSSAVTTVISAAINSFQPQFDEAVINLEQVVVQAVAERRQRHSSQLPHLRKIDSGSRAQLPYQQRRSQIEKKRVTRKGQPVFNSGAAVHKSK